MPLLSWPALLQALGRAAWPCCLLHQQPAAHAPTRALPPAGPPLPPPRRGPSVTPQVVGPHSANFFVTPPLDAQNNPIGAPFQSYELSICLVSSPTTCIGPKPLCTPNANPTATTQCSVTAPDCADTATTCLRANTQYTVVAVGVRSDGVRSLDSNKPPFTTANHE